MYSSALRLCSLLTTVFFPGSQALRTKNVVVFTAAHCVMRPENIFVCVVCLHPSRHVAQETE